jgi:hypothetical protein
MDGSDNDAEREEQNHGTDPTLPLHRPKHSAHYASARSLHLGGNVMMPWDAWDLMGTMVGAAAVVRRPCSRAVDCMLQTAATLQRRTAVSAGAESTCRRYSRHATDRHETA